MSAAEMEIHPAAAVFPMLSDDELADLAEDIKVNGLLHPIVRDTKGRIVDGRNRYVACRRAGVAPTFTTLRDDADSLAFIISANLNRRDLKPGQKAMALADLLSFHNYENYGTLGGLARAGGIAPQDLSYARTVRPYDDLADQVRAGASLQAAHKEAVQRKRRAEDAEAMAERELAYLAEQQQRAIERLEAARAAVGPAVTIPAEPELAIVLTSQTDGIVGPDPAPKLGDNLDRESAFLGRLDAARRLIEAVADEGPIDDAWYFEGHVMAVRSWASRTVALVYGMVERYNAALDGDGRLRRVK